MKKLSVNKTKIILIIYCIFVFLFVIIKINDHPFERMNQISTDRQWGYPDVNLKPFQTITSQLWMISSNLHSRNAFWNLSANIFAFLPLGYLLPKIYPKLQTLFFALLIYIIIITLVEVFQHLSTTGYFDVDDIILNVFGCFLGYLCFLINRMWWKRNQ